MFHPWSAADVTIGADEELVRLVMSFATTTEEVDQFLGAL
jgi:threonine aldolase